MGLDQGIRRMTPEIAEKLLKWQEGDRREDDEQALTDAEHDSIERVWTGRKENHIRQAVQTLTGKEPVNCGYVFLRKEDMNALVNRLRMVSEDASKAAVLLPTQSGFFFGSTEYGEYYFEDVKRELEDFQQILDEWDESSAYGYWEWW
jgi:hypothetical protein